MLLVYGRALNNGHRARRLYGELYPTRRLHSHDTFANTYRRLRETGKLQHREPGVRGRPLDVAVDERILAAFDDDPTISIRKVATELGLSVWKVWSVLRNDCKHPFHHTPVQESTRIVSGWEAEESQIPYQISLRMVSEVGGVSACGGTIIHNEWALTAAHCTALRVSIVIRTGTVNLTRPESIFETISYINHPLYIEELQSVVQPHDIGLIYFNRFIEFTPRAQPIRLQSSIDMNKDYNNIRLQASGWGRTWTEGTSPENLNWVYLLGVSNAFCRDVYGGSSIITPSTMCAAAYNVSSQSTCQGDSGGPLVVVDEDGLLTQVGISSFVSSSGCHTDLPAGFIRPGHYHDWFYEVTGINFDWVPEPPTTAAPSTEEPEADTTTSETSETEAPSTEPVTESTTTEEPETDAPTTKEPEPEVTTTEKPEIETTTTQKPETDTPTTTETEPETEVTTTKEPEIETTTTQKPETDAPSTTETEPETEVTTSKEPEIETTTTQKSETVAATTTETETEPEVTTTN
ncbi:unnamed protein product [Parnassius apollo]|uniref:(apollo) hypothetical protein n=1 Tax=Parnassius apollo TaxID=110799 RepID=A0A8S3XZL5_PARAO|nr:unnamed protein product [Parnassius apollo]